MHVAAQIHQSMRRDHVTLDMNTDEPLPLVVGPGSLLCKREFSRGLRALALYRLSQLRDDISASFEHEAFQ